MEHRDRIEIEIERISQFLYQLINLLSGSPSSEMPKTEKEQIQNAFAQLDLDISALLSFNNSELELYFRRKRRNKEHIGLIAKIADVMAENC